MNLFRGTITLVYTKRITNQSSVQDDFYVSFLDKGPVGSHCMFVSRAFMLLSFSNTRPTFLYDSMAYSFILQGAE